MARTLGDTPSSGILFLGDIFGENIISETTGALMAKIGTHSRKAIGVYFPQNGCPGYLRT